MKTPPHEPGTYALLLSLSKTKFIEVGRLGTRRFLSGWYLYVGSAMGPGGLAARVGRHLKMSKKHHWHMDYLRPVVEVLGVLWVTGTRVEEHRWASRLMEKPLSGQQIKGFGCSDCRCDTHLFYYRKHPHPPLLARHLRAKWLALERSLT